MTTPIFDYNETRFAALVGFCSGDRIPDPDPEIVWFYRYNADDLIILTQKGGKVVEAISPKYRVEYGNPHLAIQKLYEKGFKEDGTYLVDYRLANKILKFTPSGGEINWDVFELDYLPSKNMRKVLAVISGKICDNHPFVFFPETYAPSLFSLVNYRDYFLAPASEPSIFGSFVIAKMSLDSQHLPVPPYQTIVANLTRLAPRGKAKIVSQQMTTLEGLIDYAYGFIDLEEEFEDEMEDDEDTIESYSLEETLPLEAVVALFNKGEIAYSSEDRLIIEERKAYDFNHEKLIFTYHKLFVHVTDSTKPYPTLEEVRKKTGLPINIEIKVLPPREDSRKDN